MKKDEKRIAMLEWYIKVLTEREIKVDVNEITSEAVELGIDEVDLYFLPEEEFKKIPPTLLFETYVLRYRWFLLFWVCDTSSRKSNGMDRTN